MRERLVYDAEQIEEFVAALEPGNERVRAAARSMTGNVWAARIFARKVGGAAGDRS